ncbi:hypothetical protein N7470_002590 [Penicillium chermesinum]|nr:hypothetical protein N7470_002590 [Penicillium chermesinum]
MAGDPTPASAPRKRGRPRTVTGDHDVPERRRNQLRVAQQAYRKRKETTISNLQTRVQQLEAGIEKFSQSFLSFSNMLLEARVLQSHPEIARSLQEITQECVTLAQQGSNDTDGKVEAEAPSSDDNKQPAPHPSQAVIANKESDLFRDYAINQMPQSISKAKWPNMLQSPLSPQQQRPFPDLSFRPYELVLSTDASLTDSHSSPELLTPPDTELPSGMAQEDLWSLAHRIVRECCKNGYRLLVEQFHRTEKIKEVFGGPLTLSERNRKISGFLSVVNGSAGDALELRANVIGFVKKLKDDMFPLSDEYKNVPPTWKIVLEADPAEWLDANGIQKLLYDRGLLAEERSLPNGGVVLTPNSRLNVAAFVSALSLGPVCIGLGPAFRRLDVENALLLATSLDPLDPWSYQNPCSTDDYFEMPDVLWDQP